MTITPGDYDFEILKGGSFDELIYYTDACDSPIDLTGWSAKMQCRATLDSPTAFLTLTTADSSIVLGGVDGTIQLKASPATTAALTPVKGVYDLRLTAPGGQEVDFVIAGKITVRKMATQ